MGNNERLEFLGDSVLGLVVAEYLFTELPDRPEGDLAKIKSFVVSEESLAEVARRLKVDNFVLIGKGEEYSGGRSKKAILADALEAIIGAYFLDSGFKAAGKFILKCIVPEINKVLQDRHRKDYKTLLQEMVQKRFKTYPRYELVRRTGPDHNKTFWMEVRVNERTYGPGSGKNKKEAEQAAARIAYQEIENRYELSPGPDAVPDPRDQASDGGGSSARRRSRRGDARPQRREASPDGGNAGGTRADPASGRPNGNGSRGPRRKSREPNGPR